MKKILISAVLSVFFVQSAYCAPKKPDWLGGNSKRYSESEYVTGVGIAKDQEKAKEAARAEIAKVFSARVQQTALDIESETVSSSGSKVKREKEQRSKVDTKVSTDETIEGIKIADTWFDKKSKNHYALALLSKAKVRADIASQLNDIEGNIQARSELAEVSSSLPERIRAYNQVLRLMDTKETLLARQRVVDTAIIPDVPTGDTRAHILKKRDDAMGRMAFVVDSGDQSGLRKAITAKISSLGFSVLDRIPEKLNKENVIVQVRCSFELYPVERDNPQWKFFGWKGSAELIETMSGQSNSFASVVGSGEISRLNEKAAKQAAEQDAEEKLALLVKDRVGKYLFGE